MLCLIGLPCAIGIFSLLRHLRTSATSVQATHYWLLFPHAHNGAITPALGSAAAFEAAQSRVDDRIGEVRVERPMSNQQTKIQRRVKQV